MTFWQLCVFQTDYSEVGKLSGMHCAGFQDIHVLMLEERLSSLYWLQCIVFILGYALTVSLKIKPHGTL